MKGTVYRPPSLSRVKKEDETTDGQSIPPEETWKWSQSGCLTVSTKSHRNKESSKGDRVSRVHGEWVFAHVKYIK